MIILALKKKEYIKTLGYGNISSKDNTMENEETSISFVKKF
jgi:hypothetical protein